jgi:hypothetical protein
MQVRNVTDIDYPETDIGTSRQAPGEQLTHHFDRRRKSALHTGPRTAQG